MNQFVRKGVRAQILGPAWSNPVRMKEHPGHLQHLLNRLTLVNAVLSVLIFSPVRCGVDGLAPPEAVYKKSPLLTQLVDHATVLATLSQPIRIGSPEIACESWGRPPARTTSERLVYPPGAPPLGPAWPALHAHGLQLVVLFQDGVCEFGVILLPMGVP